MQPLRFVVRHQTVHQWRELSVDHFVQLVQRQPDAMVAHTVFAKIVGPDLFGAVSGFDLSATFGENRCLLLVHLQLVEPRAQYAHGFGAILDL